MKIENIKAVKWVEKKGGKRTVGSLGLGSQSCYDKPSLLITFNDNDKNLQVEIQLPKEICEDLGYAIIEYSKHLEDSCIPYPVSNGVPHDWNGKF